MDLDKLGEDASKSEVLSRPINPDRVLHADSDFYCYECSNLNESLLENFDILKSTVESKRIMAGAVRVISYLTLGLKSGREEMATIKPYQRGREESRCEDTKARVKALRLMLGNEQTERHTGILCFDQEADDAMAQAQMTYRIKYGNSNSVIMSGDKDLWMVPGLHCDQKTGEMYNVNGYGTTEFREVGNKTPKLVGTGTSWFWHQMLMGDGADKIPGLPKITGRLANHYLPTKVYNPNRSDLLCGQAKAVAVLKTAKCDKDAISRVLECYRAYYGTRAEERMFEQAYLLWMRLKKNPLDVLDYWESIGFKYTLTSQQLAAVKLYEEKVVRMEEENGTVHDT